MQVHMSYNLSKFLMWASPQKRENHANLSRFSLDLAGRTEKAF